MPCYQPTNFPPGFTTTGRTAHKTEAECLQACQEGACCEGTTCSVKPQCQCQCTTGRCCGPDLVEVRTGEFYPAYRVETKAACLARGGSWKCGSFGPQSIEGVLPSAVGKPVCPVNAGTPEPVFKGVGTTCAPSPCCGGCFVSIGAKVPSSASGVASAGAVLTRGSACNCEVPGYPYFYIGLLCTSSGMRVNVIFWPDAAGSPLSRLWSPLLSLTIPADCSGVTYATQCASNVGAERVDCGASGWPTTTTTFTRSDFSDVAASWGPIPYASLSAGNKSIFDAYFPEFVSVYPSANPLP